MVVDHHLTFVLRGGRWLLGADDETLSTGRRAMIVLTAGLEGGGEAVDALIAAASHREAERIAATLPTELAQLRAGLNKRSSDPRDR